MLASAYRVQQILAGNYLVPLGRDQRGHNQHRRLPYPMFRTY